MCRYMYIYFSNCSHQTFILLDCCSAADIRTVVNVARKGPKIHSAWVQKYSHPASGLLPPNNFHRTVKSSRVGQDECEQPVGLPDTEKSVGGDHHLSHFRACPPSLGVPDDPQNVGFDNPIGKALSNDTHMQPRHRSGDNLATETGLPAHLQRPQELKAHCPSHRVRPNSPPAVEFSLNSTLESRDFHFGRDRTEDVASRLQCLTIDKAETGRLQGRTSWAAQVAEELQSAFVHGQSAKLSEEYAPRRPRSREAVGERASRYSNRSLPEAQNRGMGRSESAVHGGQNQSAILPLPPLRSPRRIKSTTEEGIFNHPPGVSSTEIKTRVKDDRSASPKNKLSSSTMYDAAVLGSGPVVLSGDQHTHSSAAPTQSQRSQGAAKTIGGQPDQALSKPDGSTPSEQLLKANNKAFMSNSSQATGHELQHSIPDSRIQEPSVNHEARAHFSVTDAAPIRMTWAQRVQAGLPKATMPRSEQRFLSQDLLAHSAGSGSSPQRSGSRRRPSKNLSVAPVSDSLHVSSPPADDRALPTVSSTCAQTSRSGASDEDLRKDLQSSTPITLDGMQAEEDFGSEWHIVVRKNRVPQTTRSSKASKTTRRKAKSLKKLSPTTPAAPAPIQNAAIFSPSLPPHSSFSPSSESMPTLLKPSYAAVASLRSPVISISSSTTSSADAPFISAPQSPEHPRPASDILLGSPARSDNYFSAAEDLEEAPHRPTQEYTSEGHLGSWEAPAAIVLAETDIVPTTSAQDAGDAFYKQIQKAENLGPKSPNSVTDDTPLGWTDQDRAIIRHRQSPEHSVQRSAAESLRVTNKSERKERKLTESVSYDSLGNDDSSGGTSRKCVRGGFPDAKRTPARSQDDGRGSACSDPGDPITAQKVPRAGTGGCRNGTKAISSPRHNSEDKPMTSVRDKELYHQELNTRLTEIALPVLKESSGASESKPSTVDTSKRSHKSSNTSHDSKPDASTWIRATPGSPKTMGAQQVSPLSVLTSPRNVLTSSHRREPRSASLSSQNSTQDFFSESRRRGRAGGRIAHEVATGVNIPRDGSILRGEAPEFTPKTTPSKSRNSTLQSPASLDSHMPESLVQPFDLGYAAFGLRNTPTAVHNLSGVRDQSKELVLMPWMSRNFWLPKNTVAMAHETQCVLVRKSLQSGSREQTQPMTDYPGRVGQIRRLKPCGFIEVEQAVEQIGTWCPRCDPDH